MVMPGDACVDDDTDIEKILDRDRENVSMGFQKEKRRATLTEGFTTEGTLKPPTKKNVSSWRIEKGVVALM